MADRAWSALESGSGWLLAAWRGHLLGYWTGAINHQGMHASAKHLTDYSRRNPSKHCAYVCVLLDGFHLPSSEARSEMIEIAPQLQGRLHGFGIVVAGKGFKGAAIRGFITSIAYLSRVEFPVPTFDHVAEADAWFRSRVTLAQDDWGALGELAVVDAEIRTTHFAG